MRFLPAAYGCSREMENASPRFPTHAVTVEVAGPREFRMIRVPGNHAGEGSITSSEKAIYMAQATVKRFNARKSFGFIQPSDGSPGVVLHYSEIQGSGFPDVEEDQQGEVEVGEVAKRPRPSGVTRCNPTARQK